MSVPNYVELTERVWALWDLLDFGSLARSECTDLRHNKFEGWVGFTLEGKFIKVKYKSKADNETCQIIVDDEVVVDDIHYDDVVEEIENRFDIMVTSFL